MNRFSSNASVLQWIDRRISVVVCFGLTVIRKIADLMIRTQNPSAVKRILFLKLAEQGSTVLAHAAISAAVRRVGRENVFFLVFEENRFILDALGLIPEENVLTIRTKTFWQMVTSCVRQLIAIRRLEIDACLDMEFLARSSAALCYITGARVRVGFHCYFNEGPYRGDLMTHRLNYNAHLHTSLLFLAMVKALDASPDRLPSFPADLPLEPEPLPQFAFALPEKLAVEEMLRRELGVIPRLILLNANASDLLPLRRWESGNYVELARRLLQEFSEVFVGFTGSPDEAEKTAAIVREVGSPRAVCFAGKTTLRQLLILYSFADVLVTNDSGPAHFAALTPIDTVTLFGPETPLLFKAITPRSHVVWLGLPCSPCVNAFNNRQTACTDNQCMRKISVDLVFSTVCRVYKNRRKQLPQ